MICLRCGWCCKNMSPLNGGLCQYLSYDGSIAVCAIYRDRPMECYKHPGLDCPIGNQQAAYGFGVAAVYTEYQDGGGVA